MVSSGGLGRIDMRCFSSPCIWSSKGRIEEDREHRAGRKKVLVRGAVVLKRSILVARSLEAVELILLVV